MTRTISGLTSVMPRSGTAHVTAMTQVDVTAAETRRAGALQTLTSHDNTSPHPKPAASAVSSATHSRLPFHMLYRITTTTVGPIRASVSRGTVSAERGSQPHADDANSRPK